MFEIQKLEIGRFEAVRLVNKHTLEYLEVLTGFGAGINDLVLLNGDGQRCAVVDGYRTEEEICNDHHTKFKGSKLSPFPNRIYEGKYTFKHKTYQLPINEVEANNNLHAFLHNKPFQVLDHTADAHGAGLKLKYAYKGTEMGYPFPYEIVLSYGFDQDGVIIGTEVTNTGPEELPIGDGWHPYFKFEDINKVELQMDEVNRVSSNRGNPLGPVMEYRELSAIGSIDWDDCFEIIDNERFTLKLKDNKSKIELAWWQDGSEGKYHYLQVYTPPTRNSIAIEPVTCAPNGFNTGEGMITLKPNDTMSMSFGIKNIRQTK